jgi:hypothetical protein
MISPNLFFVYSATKFDHEQLHVYCTISHPWKSSKNASQVTNAPSLIFLIPCLPFKTPLASRSGSKVRHPRERWGLVGRRWWLQVKSQMPQAWSFSSPACVLRLHLTGVVARAAKGRMTGWQVAGTQTMSWAFFVTGGKYALSLCHRTTSIFVRFSRLYVAFCWNSK